MTSRTATQWAYDGWRGWIDLGARVSPGWLLAEAARDDGRRSRHARTRPVASPDGLLWLKSYAAPDGFRARRAWRMERALRARGIAVPDTVLVGTRGAEGLLVTRDVGGRELLDVVAERGRAGAAGRAAKRRLLRALGETVADVHRSAFVHGDLVPSNVQVRDDAFVFLDHDRTRHGRLLVWWGGRRNLVQLGRFVVPGVTVTDRARVLSSYAARARLSRRNRHRLARWLVAKTIRRRCAIDHIAVEDATRAGFSLLMRSGGPFDPAGVRGRA